jgi:hypothetical protein
MFIKVIIMMGGVRVGDGVEAGEKNKMKHYLLLMMGLGILIIFCNNTIL